MAVHRRGVHRGHYRALRRPDPRLQCARRFVVAQGRLQHHPRRVLHRRAVHRRLGAGAHLLAAGPGGSPLGGDRRSRPDRGHSSWLWALPGRPGVTPVKPPEDGWHWTEWWAELTGTAVLLFAIVTARYWAIRGGPPWSDRAITIAIIGMAAGLAVLGVAVSPLGRRSGAHLNPAVTIGLWLQKVTSRADLAGYCTAQIAGGIAGVVAARAWGAQVARPPVHWAVIAPAAWMPPAAAPRTHAAATSVQLLLLYAALASSRHHQWAPHVACCMLTVFIIAVVPLRGGR